MHNNDEGHPANPDIRTTHDDACIENVWMLL